MDGMEEYTVNDDLRACGLPADDDDDQTTGAEALFSSSVAPINVDASKRCYVCSSFYCLFGILL